jgi:hypothetical protein
MIHPYLQMLLAQARVDDLRRTAAAHTRLQHPSQPQPPVAAESRVTLRLGTPADEGPLAKLADLNSANPPRQPILLAEVGGELHAALSITDGTIVADPFHRTTGVIELLHARARQLEGDSGRARFGLARSWPRIRLLGCR